MFYKVTSFQWTLKSFAQEIQEHALKYFDLNTYHYIKTTRSCIFNSGQCFYKHAMAKPSILSLNLKIDFGGEEGIDDGTLRKEFFLSFFKCADER